MEKYWYQRQLRFLQTVLREKDLEGYDADGVIRYMKESHTNCLVVNAGGVIDFFPGSLKMGRPNRFLGEQDILNELAKKCHANGMYLLVRVDFRGVEEERYNRHPSWFGCDQKGEPLKGWGDRMIRPCYTSYYGREYAEQFIHELMSRYELDGVWENCVIFGFGPCYCKNCREGYRAYSGKDIPEDADYDSEEFREYREWKAIQARAHMERMRRAVKQFGEDKAYVSEIFGMYHVSTSLSSGIDLYDSKDAFDFLVSPLFLDGSARPDKRYEDYSHAASGIKFLKSICPDKTCVALTGGNGTKWRYVKAPKLESRIWMWEAVSAGGNLWNTYFNGQHPDCAVDRRNAFLEKDIYTYLEEKESFLADQIPEGEIGLYYSRPTRDRMGSDRESEDEYGCFIRGAERVLFENHFQYRFLTDLHFGEEELKGIKVLLLPNAAYISDEHLEVIRRFVWQGGGLVASWKTSLYDETGKKREDFALADLFGCSFTGLEKDTSQDCYQRVCMSHPVLKEMDAEHTRMIINEGKTLLCTRTDENAQMVCAYVPFIYNQPPEYAWLSKEETEYPTILAGDYGAGRVVYFANQTDKSCYTNGHEDLTDTYRNAILWAGKEDFSFCSDAPESVHICMTHNRLAPGKKVICAVNTSSGPFRPVRSLVSVNDVTIKVRMKGWKCKEVLKADGPVDFEYDGKEWVKIRIASLKEFTSIYLEEN